MSPASISSVLYPDPGELFKPAAWEDVEKLSMHYPQVHAALYLWRRGEVTKEQALITACHALARSVSALHAQQVSAEARVGDLQRIVRNLKTGSCWCLMGIGNPMVKEHSQTCDDAAAAVGGKR